MSGEAIGLVAVALSCELHTGQELAMMLAGAKPLAVFADDHPSLHGHYIIPEREFEPYVASGHLVKREYISAPKAKAPIVDGQKIGIRRVLYALSEQQWRTDAYLLLLKTSEKTGWNEGFEARSCEAKQHVKVYLTDDQRYCVCCALSGGAIC